jgi:hypothetical protein
MSKLSCTLENGRGDTLEKTHTLEEPSSLVKARLEIDESCMRPLQCHRKKQAKPKEDLWSPFLSKPREHNNEPLVIQAALAMMNPLLSKPR